MPIINKNVTQYQMTKSIIYMQLFLKVHSNCIYNEFSTNDLKKKVHTDATVCVYRGYGVQGVLYGQQEDLVATVGVVSVGRPGDSLGCGVIKVRLLA